jgi:hypothetical protein
MHLGPLFFLISFCMVFIFLVNMLYVEVLILVD